MSDDFKGQSPWGAPPGGGGSGNGSGRGPTPPNVDELIRDLQDKICLLYTSPSPRDYAASRMPSSA